jgi:uncharacterized protein GlcG (DUF336 family)
MLYLSEARACADRAIEAAERLNVGMSVAVVDAFGRLLQLDRMATAPLVSIELAEAKAITALQFACSTAELAGLVGQGGALLDVYRKVDEGESRGPAGGLPIVQRGRVVGAIGVAGTARSDEDIARSAVADSGI